MREPTAEQFLKDVQSHKMTILHEQDVYRHIQFKQSSFNMWFDIITWPGSLTIHGDMGCWTFSRVKDMFTFFRSDKLEINPDYWAEKLQHGVHSGRDGAKVWEEEAFKKRLLEHLSWSSYEGEQLAQIQAGIKEEIFCRDNEWEMKIAARDFKWRFESGDEFYFDIAELPDGMEYAYHFIWCLYAIVWGIQQWDARQAVAA